MGYYSEIDSGELVVGGSGDKSKSKSVRQNNAKPQCLPRSSLPLPPSSSKWKSNADGKRPLGSYTTEERRRGGINRAAKARAVIHDLIEEHLPIAIKLSEMDCQLVDDFKSKFVMAQFVRDYLPLKSTKDAVRNYGAFIKAKLKYYETTIPVMNMGRFIDKIRAGLAKKNAKISTVPIFQQMKGVIVRLSSNIYRTTCKHEGGEWICKMGIWGYFVNTETGECFN